jgi:hypothetical protein
LRGAAAYNSAKKVKHALVLGTERLAHIRKNVSATLGSGRRRYPKTMSAPPARVASCSRLMQALYFKSCFALAASDGRR